MPSFTHRHETPEMMDDLSITDARLDRALVDLRRVNRFLGGYGPALRALEAALPATRPARVLDVGTGSADFPDALVRWADRAGREVAVEGVDVNPATLAHAAAFLDRRLPPALRARVTLREADALRLPYADGAFDAVHAAYFLHHFEGARAVALLRELRRVAPVVIVSDLHRHPAAYYSIRVLARLSPSEMFRLDAPLSVLRGFRRRELAALLAEAGLEGAIRWRWAFRWVVTARSAGAGASDER